MMLRKKHLMLLAMVIGLAGSIHAQSDRRANIVLINGKKMLGATINSFDGNSMNVSIDDDNSIVLRYDLIKKINFKGKDTDNELLKQKFGSQATIKTETFYHELRSGTLFGQENIDVSLHTLNGYQFNKYLGTALGVGLNKYGNYLTMPLYAQVKGYIMDRKVSPFYFGDLGYAPAWKTRDNDEYYEIDQVKGGLYWQIGLGYQLNFPKSAMTFSFGYSSQDSEAKYSYQRYGYMSSIYERGTGEVVVTEYRELRRFSVSVGFLF